MGMVARGVEDRWRNDRWGFEEVSTGTGRGVEEGSRSHRGRLEARRARMGGFEKVSKGAQWGWLEERGFKEVSTGRDRGGLEESSRSPRKGLELERNRGASLVLMLYPLINAYTSPWFRYLPRSSDTVG